ncbi:SUMF1/EgtB/PvdO family nonheme iron enzyme [uncultured Pontibacter sp.]|uniref:SUMF1/EgtB/PvdO family nonheme iron enzyme n=1 Tax=uncultured Pontibacter sp. TaxID=453356 RepID=UPI00262ACF3C|nr:SUMF1/EgtB/PvdO family nonheme iron enzyme [uncultured Pontibacter sp.]
MITSLLTFILFLNLNSTPPGTKQVKNYHVDTTEILNIHWLEYIHHRENEIGTADRHKLLPDSANTWYRKSENHFKPIVLISYEQALDYCAWRSKVVSKKLGKNVTYRLPTASEWTAIAEEIIKTDLKQQEKNLAKTKKAVSKITGQYFLIDSRKQEKSNNSIYNLFDNVSEMTAEKGVSMGANNHQLFDLKENANRTISYDGPSPYLGFRCIVEIEE